MIEGLLGNIKDLCSLLRELLDQRATRRRDLFERYVEPSFELAKKVHSDLRCILTETKESLEIGSPFQKVLEDVEAKRARLLPARIELRALILAYSPEDLSKAGSFEKGLWHLMFSEEVEFVAPVMTSMAPGEEWSELRLLSTKHRILGVVELLERATARECMDSNSSKDSLVSLAGPSRARRTAAAARLTGRSPTRSAIIEHLNSSVENLDHEFGRVALAYAAARAQLWPKV